MNNRLLRIAVLALIVGFSTSLITYGLAKYLQNGALLNITLVDGPRGLTASPDGSLLIADTKAGNLLRASMDGGTSLILDGLPHTFGGPAGNEPIGPSAAVQVGDTYYYIVGEFRGSSYSTLYRYIPGSNPVPVAGGIDSDGFPATQITNPFDLVVSQENENEFFISDSGRNAILMVDESGKVSEYSVFPRLDVPDSEGRLMDVVPTGIAYGPDGALYVASLTGFPYPKSSANVYRMDDINGDGDALDEGETQVYATGFTATTDIAFERDGSLLVTEFSVEMNKLVTELGIERAAEAPGRLVRWRGGAIEVVAEGLVSPTSVAVLGDKVIVSEEFAGRVREIPKPQANRISAVSSIAAGIAAALITAATCVFVFKLKIRNSQRSS